jgi:phosphonate utilization transcriptional regulator
MGERLADIAILQSHSLTMLVQRELERMVLTGELGAGKKLNEAEISLRLGVSRGPVRESFRALQETGLVRLEKNRGVFVREVSVDEADDIYEIRATLDQMAGRKLAASIRPEQLAALRALVARMRAAAETGDVEGYHEANLAFHDALVEYAGNPKLLQIYRRLVNELSLFRRHTLAQPHRLPSSTLEHEEILALIETGQVEATGQKLHEHAIASRGRVHALASTVPSPSPVGRAPSGRPRS